jgi:hypothetical protein
MAWLNGGLGYHPAGHHLERLVVGVTAFGYLRILGGVVAALMLAGVAVRWRRRRLRIGDTLIMGGLAVGLAVVAIDPDLVQPFLNVLGFKAGNFGRVIGVLVVSSILVYVLLFRSFLRTSRLEDLLGDYANRLALRQFVGEYGAEEPNGHKLAVVIPALNEESSLPLVLGVMPKQVLDLETEVIVVSDGSTDATEGVAREHGALVVGRDLRRGQGAAVALGYQVALLRGAAVVATCDADGQYDPLELPQLVRPIIEGDADVVHGSRMLEGGGYERPMFGRSHGVRVFAKLTTLIARSPITDPASGFRAFTADALRRLEFRERQFHASEVTVAAVKQGLRVREVPCTFRERFEGQSKKPPLLKYGLGYARSLIRTWLG